MCEPTRHYVSGWCFRDYINRNNNNSQRLRGLCGAESLMMVNLGWNWNPGEVTCTACILTKFAFDDAAEKIETYEFFNG